MAHLIPTALDIAAFRVLSAVISLVLEVVHGGAPIGDTTHGEGRQTILTDAHSRELVTKGVFDRFTHTRISATV